MSRSLADRAHSVHPTVVSNLRSGLDAIEGDGSVT